MAFSLEMQAFHPQTGAKNTHNPEVVGITIKNVEWVSFA